MAKQLPTARKWRDEWAQLRDGFIAEGLDNSDAQGCADSEMWRRYGLWEHEFYALDPWAWIAEGERREKLQRERLGK